MKIRPKTIRRLLLLAAVAGASAAIVGAAFTARRHARDAELANARITGMQAFEAGDLEKAMPALSLYVSARSNDVDALYALACAHVAVETPGRDNLFDARSRLQQVLARKPDHLLAKRQLMKIYERTRLPRELLTLSEDVLKTAPRDVEASRCRAVALVELEREADALPAWSDYLKLVPTDFRAQGQLLATMKRAGRSPDELVAYARGNVERWPNDPRFLLPLAAALREAGRDSEAQSMLEELAAKPQSDVTFVVELAAALDRVRSFDAAEQLLARSAESLKSTSLNAALVERMWQNARHAQVITATDGLLSIGRREPNILALRALSLSAMDRRADALAIAAEIRAMVSDEQATAWSAALAVEFEGATMTPADQARKLREALDHDPGNGILYAWLGRALRNNGEPEQAARCFREAAQRLPSWPTPCVELADAMLELGRTSDAAAAAKMAYLRAPSNMAVQLQVARVRFAELNSKATPAEVAELLTRVEELARRLPGESSPPAMRASLLASQGRRDEAEAIVSDAVATLPRGANLHALYEISRRAGLKSNAIVFARIVSDGTLTPALAVSHAVELAAKPDGAASAIAWVKAQAATHRGKPAWALAETRVRQSLGDPEAPASWRQLVANFPNDLAVQSAALTEAAPFLGQRAEQAAVVERVKIIAGEDAPAYRVARARWLAASNDNAEARQALTIAADLVRSQPARADLRLLLARVLVRLDSAATAVDHLRAAHDQSPADAAIALELADTLRRAGRWADSVALLKTQASYDVDSPGTRAALAQALIDAGAFQEAAALLQRTASRGTVTLPERLMIATALDALGNTDGAAAAYDAVATDDAATPVMLAKVAAFERRQGRVDRASAMIERIERSKANADDRARAVAGYAAESGDISAARARYAAELEAGKAGAELMIEAIELEASQGDLAAATALAARAAEKFPSDPNVRRATLQVAARRASTESGGQGDSIDRLIALMASDPESRQEVAALRALRQAQAGGRPTPELATRLAALADEYPAAIDLSRSAIQTSLATAQPQVASAVARRLLASSGTQVDAVALAARTLLAIGDLPAARRAGERWRSMAKTHPRDADVVLAEIALAESAPERALAALEPHRATIAWDRDDGALVAVLTEALARSGRALEAFSMMEPALQSSPPARSAWLRVVSLTRDATGEAAAARLDHLTAATPPDATGETVRLASAYLDLAQACGTRRAAERGIELLAPVEASGRLAGNGRALLAELQRAAGALEQAQATLREALKGEPDNAMVKNSLAYVLLSVPGAADEACRLAGEAVAASPREAGFHDTLARALLSANQRDRAEAAFREAVHLNENCVDAWVGLAKLQAQVGKIRDAQASVARLDAALARTASREPPLHLREELRTVRQSVASARE